MITVFLGTGFSHTGKISLASQIFDEQPEVDLITRQHLIERVLSDWKKVEIQT